VNFLITILRIFCDSLIQSLKDFNSNILYIHFCFSELLILREKKVRGFFFGHWSTKKNYNFSKNIEKTPYRRVAQK